MFLGRLQHPFWWVAVLSTSTEMPATHLIGLSLMFLLSLQIFEQEGVRAICVPSEGTGVAKADVILL